MIHYDAMPDQEHVLDEAYLDALEQKVQSFSVFKVLFFDFLIAQLLLSQLSIVRLLVVQLSVVQLSVGFLILGWSTIDAQ
jgi:hypothetical protein